MKKYLICMFAVVFLGAVSLSVRVRAAGAEVFSIDGKGTVTVTSEQAAGDGASTFQFGLCVDAPDGASVEFRFQENGAKVQEFRYDSDGKKLNVYVAGTQALFTADTASLNVGRVVVLDRDGNDAAAAVSVEENSFQYVYGTELKQVADMTLPGTVQIGPRDPDPGTSEQPDDDDDSQDDDDASQGEDNSSQGGNNNSQGNNNSSQGNNNSQGSNNSSQGNNNSQGSNNSSQGSNNNSQGGNNSSQGSNNASQGNNNSSQGSNNNSQGVNNASQGSNNGSQGGDNSSLGNEGSGSAGGNGEGQGQPSQTVDDPVPLIQVSPVETGGDAQDAVKPAAGMGWIIAVVIVAVLAIAVAAAVLVRKKRADMGADA